MAQAMLKPSLVGKLEVDVEIKTPAKKFHQVIAGRPHNIPKITPDGIKRCDLVKGELGKVGSIIFWSYVFGGQQKVMKERIEEVEPEKNMIALRVIEGDIMREFKSFLVTIQVTTKQRGRGSMVKCNIDYERTNEKVAHPETLLSAFFKVFKDIDEMLLSEE